jgi:hypothetical protein
MKNYNTIEIIVNNNPESNISEYKYWLTQNCVCIGVSLFAGFIIGTVVWVLITFY